MMCLLICYFEFPFVDRSVGKREGDNEMPSVRNSASHSVRRAKDGLVEHPAAFSVADADIYASQIFKEGCCEHVSINRGMNGRLFGGFYFS